ncbi:hypothetical protein CWI39_0749p0010 [Hamiltosporidium magnivora]|uniref:Uncharacterized protein n=1 Tax=Hamiltosporidium magnivora TaxID=148818 RepID=A0A4Q9LAQ1_9MICR|nr:hypothetical protein CWI39_0749p0010 [Hamiltosporidium magnivora]
MTLIFRKFYIDRAIRTYGDLRFSFSNYRFMIFDPEISFENVIDLPDKILVFNHSRNWPRLISTANTKLKLSGKLPKISCIEDQNTILKEKVMIFSQLEHDYHIKSFWRFKNICSEISHSDEPNKIIYFYSIMTFKTDFILECATSCTSSLSSELIAKEYYVRHIITTYASIESLEFRKEIIIDFSLEADQFLITFFRKENTQFEKKFALDFSLYLSNESFEISSDHNLNITNIVDKVNKFEKDNYEFSFETASIDDFKKMCVALVKEFTTRMILKKLSIIY